MDSSSDSSMSLKRKLSGDSLIDSKSSCLSPWEYRRQRAELIQSQAQVIKLEDTIDKLHKINKEAVILFDKEKNEMKLQLDTARNEKKYLERRLNKLRKREVGSQRDQHEMSAMHEVTRLKQNEKILELENENETLRSRLATLESGNTESARELREESRRTREENAALQLERQELTELRVSLEARLAVVLQDARDSEEQQWRIVAAEGRVKELEAERVEHEAARQTTIALRDRVLRLNEIEKDLAEKKQEVADLRMAVENKLMMEERAHSLETRLAAVAGSEVELTLIKAQQEELKAELENWSSIAADFSQAVSPQSLRDYIEGLQRKELTSSVDINNLNAMIRRLESTVTTLRGDLSSLNSAYEDLKINVQKLKIENQMVRKKALLLTRERDCYREQLDSYEKDLTVTGLKEEEQPASAESHLRSKVAKMEDVVAGYRALIDSLEGQLMAGHQEGAVDYIDQIAKLQRELKSLEVFNSMLSKRKDELEEELEKRISSGEYLLPETKIVHFRRNPAAEARRQLMDEVAARERECEGLRARVKLLEEGEQLDITRKVAESVESSGAERVRELEEELSSTRLKMQRLKEVFTKTGQNFRDVSYMLLGYRIDLTTKNKYRLTNMYSDTQDDHFMFQQSESGMEMLETPFAQAFPSLVDKHLHGGNSIPAFLSAVTLNLCAPDSSNEEEEEDVTMDQGDDGNDSESPEEIELS